MKMRPPSSSQELSYSSSPPPPPPLPLHRRSRLHRQMNKDYSLEDQSSSSYLCNRDNYTDDGDNEEEEEEEEEEEGSSSYSNYPSNSQLSSSSSLLPSTYVNVAPLPTFRGSPTECPLAHLSRFRRVCIANNASSPRSILRIFPVTLLDQAALWYELNVETLPYDAQSWDRIRSSFLAAFLRPESIDRARSDLMTLKQAEGETVNMYYLRMQWIMRQWPDHGLPDGLLKGLFVDGLREDFQAWIVPQRPGTLDEAVRLAGNWEQVDTRRRKDNISSSSSSDVVVVGVGSGGSKRCGFCDGGGHEERECEVRRMMRELWLKRRAMNTGKEIEQGEGEVKKKTTTTTTTTTGEFGRVVSLERRGGGGGGGQCQCFNNKYNRSSSVVTDQKIKSSSSSPNVVVDNNA